MAEALILVEDERGNTFQMTPEDAKRVGYRKIGPAPGDGRDVRAPVATAEPESAEAAERAGAKARPTAANKARGRAGGDK